MIQKRTIKKVEFHTIIFYSNFIFYLRHNISAMAGTLIKNRQVVVVQNMSLLCFCTFPQTGCLDITAPKGKR
jgi:hypothetical protein